jgi:hypothetical protein
MRPPPRPPTAQLGWPAEQRPIRRRPQPWQEGFLKSNGLWQRIWRGKPILYVVAYYLAWAAVEWYWPPAIKD